MKIEKITENKIRIIIKSSEFNIDDLNINHLSSPTLEKNLFLINLLEKAKKEIDFETDGYKLLFETFISDDDFLVFTITKYNSQDKKVPIVKRKMQKSSVQNIIYKFDNFDDFCNFCNCIKLANNFNINRFSRIIKLYFYKNTYYLIIKNINFFYTEKKMFFSLISEFSLPISYSDIFENKLNEYGTLVIKKNAIEKGIKYFT